MNGEWCLRSLIQGKWPHVAATISIQRKMCALSDRQHDGSMLISGSKEGPD